MNESPYTVRRALGLSPLRKARPRLEQLDIELTERCNNDCIHCCINLPAADSAARERELTTRQVEHVLKQAADLGCLEVRFTGGEPLLRPDFEDLYIYARRLGLRVLLFTNACLISPRLADLFASIPPLLKIEITVYGMRQESYESVTRNPGSYTLFRRGIGLLLDRKIPFVVKSVLLRQNRGEVDEFESWAKTIPGMTAPPSYSIFLDLRGRRDNTRKNSLIRSLRLPPAETLAFLTRIPETYRRTADEFAARFMGPSGDVLFGCGAGRSISIDAYGCVQPCMGVRSPELTIDLDAGAYPARGKVMLSEALDRFQGLRAICATNSRYLSRCAKCFLKGFCEQCPAKSWSEHGTLDSPVEYLCEATHVQARYLGWLEENEYGWERECRRGGGNGGR